MEHKCYSFFLDRSIKFILWMFFVVVFFQIMGIPYINQSIILTYGPVKNVHINVNSKTFTFWTIQEFSYFVQFQNFYILDNSIYVVFWTISDVFSFCLFWIISETLHSVPLKKFYILDYSRIFRILDGSRTFTFWKTPESFLPGPF